jgi:predicted HicB family RNase H-like nuclease
MAKATPEQMAKITEWQKENVKQFTIRLNRKNDADILDVLAKQKSVQGYIKEAIREKMNR